MVNSDSFYCRNASSAVELIAYTAVSESAVTLHFTQPTPTHPPSLYLSHNRTRLCQIMCARFAEHAPM